MTSSYGGPLIFERHVGIFCSGEIEIMRLLDLLNTMDLLTWDQEHSGCRDRQDWGIKNLNKEFYLIACLMLELVGCSFTSKIIWLESLPVIRNTSFVTCHSTVQTWKKDQPSEWQWGKKIRYRAMWSSKLWSIVRTMSGYVENQFVSGLKIDPMLRSYQVPMHW